MTLTEQVRALTLTSAGDGNVLVLTSTCNVRCVFCSHRQNPRGVEVFFVPALPLEFVEEQVSLLSPHRKVVIGESATRICEGEPFTHPQIRKILDLVRQKLPKTLLQLTTNGTLLTREACQHLDGIKPVELNISLNSADPQMRRSIMGEQAGKSVLGALENCNRYGLPFHGSIVALPHITGFSDLKRTLKTLEEFGAKSIRIFLPGSTSLAPPKLTFKKELWHELTLFIAEHAATSRIPVTLEPPLLTDLRPVIEGVLRDSPSFEAGLLRGDLLLGVQGEKPFSRADAFARAKKLADPSIRIERGGEAVEVILRKEKGQAPGFVMNFDLHPDTLHLMNRAAGKHKAEKVLVLTSEFAYPLLKEAFSAAGLHFSLRPVRNTFFGGTIGCSGLLTVKDFLRTARKPAKGREGELILLPGEAFDPFGRDLTGTSYADLEEALQVSVIYL